MTGRARAGPEHELEAGHGTTTVTERANGDGKQELTSLELPDGDDRIMLYALAFEWNLPTWFDELDAVPTRSPLDVWRWAFRRFGAATFSARSLGHALAWQLCSYARAIEGEVEGRGLVVVGEAWPGTKTLAENLNINPRSLTAPIRDGESAGWWVRRRRPNRSSSYFLSLPRARPESPERTRRPDRARWPMESRLQQTMDATALANGIRIPLANGASPKRNSQAEVEAEPVSVVAASEDCRDEAPPGSSNGEWVTVRYPNGRRGRVDRSTLANHPGLRVVS